MPVTASLVGGGINLLGGLVSGLVGNKQKKEGQNILNQADKLGAFNEQIPTEITTAAAQGLPSEQYDKAMNNIQQQQLQAINASQNRRAGVGNIGNIQSATNNATLGLDALNAQTRQKNLNTLASWKDKVWQNNVKAKYNQQYNYGMGLLGAGNQNLVGGIDRATAGGAQAAFGGGLFGSGTPNPNLNYTTQNTGSPGGPPAIGQQGLGYQTQLSGGSLFGS